MRSRTAVLCSLTAIALACSNSAREAMESRDSASVTLISAPSVSAPSEGARMRGDVAHRLVANDNSAQTPAAQPNWGALKLIRTAQLAIEVDSVERAVRVADSLTRRLGAFVADVRMTQSVRSAELVVRVRSEDFTTVLSALRDLGKINDESVSTADVTKDYADLVTRMGVKQDAVTRLRKLLTDRTGRLSDVLEAERELSRAVTELEQMKGEQRYYDQQIAISTISVRLTEPSVLKRPGVMSTVSDALRRSTEGLVTSLSALIYLVTMIVPWIPIIALIWFWRRRALRRFAARPAV